MSLSPLHETVIRSYTCRFPPYSDYTLPSLWSWNIHDQIGLSHLKGNLVVRFTDYLAGDKFLSFLGQSEIGPTVDALFEFLSSTTGHLPYLKLIPEQGIQDIGAGYEISEDTDNHDYIYGVAEWVGFAGSKYERLRRKMQRFSNRHACEACELDLNAEEVWQQIRNLCTKWTQAKHSQDDVLNDIAALNRLARIPLKDALLGVGIYIDKTLAAYCIAEFVHDRYACGLFEHTDPACNGITPYLRNRFAARLQQRGCEWLNFQQDLGIPGLRTSKQRYRPAFFLKKFIIRRAKGACDAA